MPVMIPALSIVCMAVSALLSIGLPVGLYIALRGRYGLKAPPMLVGAAAFVLFALILEQILHMLVLRPDANGVIAMRSENPFLYVVYGIFAAGIFEETARYISFHLLKRKYSGIGTGISYGIGHGGIEAILLVGITMIANIIVSVTLSSGVAADVTSSLLEAQAAALSATDSVMFLVAGAERVMAVTVHMSLSILVWMSVNVAGKKWLYPAAILLHALVNTPAAMLQAGILRSIFLVEGLVLALAVGTALFTAWIYRRLKGALEAPDENPPAQEA